MAHNEALADQKMGAVSPKDRDASIVLVGEFDPMLLVPQWFVNHKLLPSEDIISNLAIEIVYKDLTRFTLPNITVEIQPDRLTLRSGIESLDFMIVDLAVGVLSLNKKLNVTAVGLNLREDYYFEDSRHWNNIGDILAPKDIWYEISPDSAKAGLTNLSMQVRRPVGERGVFNFSVSWLERRGWTRFQTNLHYASSQSVIDSEGRLLPKGKFKQGFDPLRIVSECWPDSRDFQKRAVDSLLRKAQGEVHDERS